ncbi:MAG: malonyl-ACP O-methyltransferase BioC [Pseudomonadota bacterium]
MDEHLKRAVRRAFERAAPGYDASAFLQQEVARRLDEHLEEIRVKPARVLDAGCGTGFGAGLLHARFPRAEIVGVDLAHAMLRVAAGRGRAQGWRGLIERLAPRAAHFTPLCADLERLPLREASVDMAWSSLTLQWVDLPRAFAEVRRVLRPDGLFLFATLGPDTLQELRAASSGLDGHAHVNRFVDMHDVGDALMQAGFANPVMEMERLTLTYQDLRGLFADLKGIGAQTVLEGRRAGLMGKTAWAALARNYEAFRRDGRLPATYELVYGHAWAGRPAPRADGRQVIEFRRRPK